MKKPNSNLRLVALAVVLYSLGIVACSKESGCKNVDPATEDAAMQTYNEENNITATKHYTGMYYQILDTGSLTRPTVASRVYVKYRGELLDGTVFDEQTNPGSTGFALSSLIQGWKYGLEMIGKGGHILLTVPSSLGYGCAGSKTNADTAKWIPSNAPLFFDIELVDFH
jgi:FKBP-type peptidyl-prolyl cis-trans isomerase